jgi:hypothetical protein
MAEDDVRETMDEEEDKQVLMGKMGHLKQMTMMMTMTLTMIQYKQLD